MSYQQLEHTQRLHFWKLTLQNYLPRDPSKALYRTVYIEGKRRRQGKGRLEGRGPSVRVPEADWHTPTKLQQCILKRGGCEEESCGTPSVTGPLRVGEEGGSRDWVPGGCPLGWTDTGLRFPLSVISTRITFSLASLFKGKRTCASASGFLQRE